MLTTILDPDRAPAAGPATLYARRWELESALDELKVHQRGPRVVLRSKLPDLVVQELYGHLCVHYAIRWLMHTIALQTGHDPDRISFTRTLRVARRTTRDGPGFPPQHSTPRLRRPPRSCSSSCCQTGGCAPTRAWPNASCPASPSSAPSTATRPSRPRGQNTPQ